MISIDSNIFLLLFLAHFFEIFYDYQKQISELWTLQKYQSLNPVFYSPASVLKGIELNISAIIQQFKGSKTNKNELKAKNLILEGIVQNENHIAFRLNVKSPIHFEYLRKKKAEFEKYDGNLSFSMKDRSDRSKSCRVEKKNKKTVKLFLDLFTYVSQKSSSEKKEMGIFRKLLCVSKSFLLEFFTFRQLTISYEESEIVLKSNDFVRVFGDVFFNVKDKSLRIEPKIVFSSLQNVIRNKTQHLAFLETKMLFYFGLFMRYWEIRFLKGKHLINLATKISNIFFQRKKVLIFDHNKIDLQTLNANKSEVKCIVCMERVREIVLKPCNHMLLCERCLYNLQELKCPLCREKIYDIIVVFGEKPK